MTANCPAKNKPRAAGTRVGVLFAGWPAPLKVLLCGTIVANEGNFRAPAPAPARNRTRASHFDYDYEHHPLRRIEHEHDLVSPSPYWL
jgi:hypothetical protein